MTSSGERRVFFSPLSRFSRSGKRGFRNRHSPQRPQRLKEVVLEVPQELKAAWEGTAQAILEKPAEGPGWPEATWPEQFHVLITCRDERQQVELLARFQAEGLTVKAVMS
jgi:hypothetical protein